MPTVDANVVMRLRRNLSRPLKKYVNPVWHRHLAGENAGFKPAPHLFQRAAGRPKTWLGVLFILLACYRFTLIDTGHFFWADERCYLPASKLVDDLIAGDYRSATGRLFEAVARPGFVAVSVVPALLQRTIGASLGYEDDALRSYDIVSAFNVIVTLGITACVYVLVRRWTCSPWYALLGAAVYSLLASANVWIRHAVPYNESLLLFLLALVALAPPPGSPNRPMCRAMLAGTLTAMAYSCYPGHYSFVLINGVVLLAAAKRRVPAALCFGGGAIAVLGVFELLSRCVGVSYLQNMRQLAGTVSMGFCGEGYVFPWRYLRDVEGTVGVTLFILFTGYAVLVLWRPKADPPRPARAALLAAIGACLLHVAMGVHLGKMVFYGRVLSVFIPFVVAGAVLALAHLPRARTRTLGVCVLAIASGVSFTTFAGRYARITYPADFLQETMIKSGREVTYPANMLWGFVDGSPDGTIESLDPDITMVVDTLPDGLDKYIILASHEEATASGKRFIGLNFKWLFNVRERDRRFTPPEGYRLLAEATHPAAFPAVFYEAYKPWGRKRLLARQYKMRLYERVGPP